MTINNRKKEFREKFKILDKQEGEKFLCVGETLCREFAFGWKYFPETIGWQKFFKQMKDF
jgi:hypothetical protein